MRGWALKSSASSSAVSCRGRSRTRTRRRAAGRDSGPRRARPRARRGGRTATAAGRRAGTCRALPRRARGCGRRRRSPRSRRAPRRGRARHGRPPPDGRARCRGRGWRWSCGEPPRLDAVLAGDLLLVGAEEPAVADDFLAGDIQPVDAVRGGEDEAGNRVARAAELEAVRPPHGEVGALAGLERAEVVAAEERRAAARAELERLADGECGRAVAAAGEEERLLHFEEEVAALVRGRAVDAEADAHARVAQGPHPGEARSQPEVRGRAVGDPRAGCDEGGDVVVVEVHAVRAPHVLGEPAEPLEVLHGSAAVELAAVLLLLDGLGEVRVEREAVL